MESLWLKVGLKIAALGNIFFATMSHANFV